MHINTLLNYHLKALDSPVYKLAPHGLTATSHWSFKKYRPALLLKYFALICKDIIIIKEIIIIVIMIIIIIMIIIPGTVPFLIVLPRSR